MSAIDYSEYVKRSFFKNCKRTPREDEIEYFIDQLKNGKTTLENLDMFIADKMKGIRKIQYHTSKGKLSTEEWMKKSWDVRASEDAKSLIWYFSKKSPLFRHQV